MRRRYLTEARAEEWVERPIDSFTLTQGVAVIRPERPSGHD